MTLATKIAIARGAVWAIGHAIAIALGIYMGVSAALADPTMNWGTSWAVLTECEEADACVFVTNTLTSSANVVNGTLSVGWVTVELRAEMFAGAIPDKVTITAPPGFIVDPPFAVIEEARMVVFRIYFPAMG